MARNLEPAIPEESLVTKLAYHFSQGVSQGRLNSQIKTIQGMCTLLESHERERGTIRGTARVPDRHMIGVDQETLTQPITMTGIIMGEISTTLHVLITTRDQDRMEVVTTMTMRTEEIQILLDQMAIRGTIIINEVIIITDPIIANLQITSICLLYTSRCV